MTAIVLPDLSQRSLSDLRDRLAEIETPSLQDVGKNADHAIDRLLGRSKTPVWTWLAVGVGVAAVIGAISAWFVMMRRPAWSQPTPQPLGGPTAGGMDDGDALGISERVEYDTLRDDDVLAAVRSNATAIEDV